MKLYSRNNPAKQWMLEEIERIATDRSLRVCDLGCGAGSVWPDFLRDHPHIAYVGLDTDAKEIERAKKNFTGCPNAAVLVADAQRFTEESGRFDIVTAFSALEHVVDLDAFIATTLGLLRSGGTALLNYDAGHFRSHDLKERLMVPVSQMLAKIGFEGPYMKEVDDAKLAAIVSAKGGTVEKMMKHNFHPLKSLFKGANDETINDWFAFESRLNEHVPKDRLHQLMWSTTLVMKKP